MGRLLFLTNMEQQQVAMSVAVESLVADKLLHEKAMTKFLTDAEPWSEAWGNSLRGSDMVLFSWMGTGLNSKFLKQASEYMQKHKIRHLFLVADPGDDVLDYGLNPTEKQTIQQYVSYNGADNYRNLWLWMSHQFLHGECSYGLPRQLPWDGSIIRRRKSLLRIVRHIGNNSVYRIVLRLR